jgi:hypothetical protein
MCFSMCSRCQYVVYTVFCLTGVFSCIAFSFLILNIRACISVCLAASEFLDVFMFKLAYFGVALYVKHVLLKYIFALTASVV